MKTYTVQFVQQKPGGIKRVPILTGGIEVVEGVVVNGYAVTLGDKGGHYWEVPLMKGHPPQVTTTHNRDVVLDCHPVPNRDRD